MNVSIASTSATTATGTNPNAIALNQMQAARDEMTDPLTVTAIDPQDNTRLNKYLRAITTPMTLGEDAQNVATALVPTMRAILRERPDLANAPFDFQSSNGSIRVVSAGLSADDKSWLQGKLNNNTDLVQAVKTFHDDAVAGYAFWADADGAPLTQAQTDEVSKKADGMVGFLNLFKSLGSDAQQYQMKDGTYTTSDGSPMDLAQDPTTAAGFLAFNKSAQASADGTFTFTANSGHVLYGSRMNIFELNSSALPHFFPPSDTKTLGFNETA
ncbi:hypothetical protein EN871_04345 [bacterium M00.F.Ca.ET.228.01.1.1]|uniref:hypothetical protein n=1 Tax=Paraburkholderia phenoliruptrix TaxID=252970 RepID=UPI0010927A8C|nr:hypothetical protein [Paraburkholderia phenoliruptrix]TGP48030.1 hypothetical protein EN871_04345 [bacterium M00.F.Ca.ET.228.01.1.1]TGS05822.1 hypothetical protein EN834_04345 [bacterium M00.F.Ca.ET.191.01.1.1]TGU10759.1 hypothetical protein EN798_04345 [bacterium M00.F.Ca.ET.155.01.1.1]MBW0445147.1 hypothetical protein [Paraburkholderia phenoliruptrix]MBW9095912.1 hypothetical protein [Paraburkholderia phenoliruptrix]